MKLRFLSLLLAVIMAAGFTGCQKGEDTSSTEISSSDVINESDESDSSMEESSEEQSSEDSSEKDIASRSYPVIISEDKVVKHDMIMTVGDAGYEYYGYVPSRAEAYTGLINGIAEKLEGTANVYNMIIPTSVGITLPDNCRDGVPGTDTKESLDKLHDALSPEVKVVDVYDALMTHRDEYIYFRTDHHWTARGAYYAYVEYCREKGFTPHELSEYRMQEFDGFLGSFYKDSGNSPALGDHPDVVEAFHPAGQNISLNFTDPKGNSYDWPIIFNVESYPANLKYSTFAASDNPYTVIENPDATDGDALIVVKESFGNCLIPFLADHYKTIYEIDYRYWKGHIAELVRETGADDVLIANNISMTRGDYLIGKLSQVL